MLNELNWQGLTESNVLLPEFQGQQAELRRDVTNRSGESQQMYGDQGLAMHSRLHKDKTYQNGKLNFKGIKL